MDELGIKRWTVDLSDWRNIVEEISLEEGFTAIAEPENPEPQLSPEHSHGGDEVRLLLEGSAVLVVRVGDSDDFITLTFSEGDMFSVPGGLWHQLGPGPDSYKSVRFFHDKGSWNKVLRN